MITARHFYLLAYDISEPRSLKKVGKKVRAYLTSGQKSVCECWMKGHERELLLIRLAELIELDHDRIHCFRLDPRMKPILMGIARRTEGRPFVIT